MDITVVIPVLNGMPDLKNQITALQSQISTYEWELVISDNGSTDDTKEFVENAAIHFQVPMRIIDSSKYPGVSGARNVGILVAQGRTVVFCDADDVVAPGWIEAIGRAREKCDIVGGPLFEHNDFSQEKYLNRNSVFTGRTGKHSIIGCNVAMRRSLLEELGGFDWSMPRYGGEDTEFAIRANQANAKFSYSEEMKLYFRETLGLKEKFRKAIFANLAEIYIWKRHPEIFKIENSKMWQIKVSYNSILSAIDLLKQKNINFALRYALKPFVILYFSLKNNQLKEPLFLSDMKIEN